MVSGDCLPSPKLQTQAFGSQIAAEVSRYLTSQASVALSGSLGSANDPGASENTQILGRVLFFDEGEIPRDILGAGILFFPAPFSPPPDPFGTRRERLGGRV